MILYNNLAKVEMMLGGVLKLEALILSSPKGKGESGDEDEYEYV